MHESLRSVRRTIRQVCASTVDRSRHVEAGDRSKFHRMALERSAVLGRGTDRTTRLVLIIHTLPLLLDFTFHTHEQAAILAGI